jgi:hypothetical protein
MIFRGALHFAFRKRFIFDGLNLFLRIWFEEILEHISAVPTLKHQDSVSR